MKKNIVKTTAKALGFAALALALTALPAVCWHTGYPFLAGVLIYPCALFAARVGQELNDTIYKE